MGRELYSGYKNAVDSRGQPIFTQARRLNYPKMLQIFFAVFVMGVSIPSSGDSFPPDLFGYKQHNQQDISVFPQWVSVLERQLLENAPEGNCAAGSYNRCHLRSWLEFLDSIRGLPRRQQLRRVNRYANAKPYVLDMENYGVHDYWAIPRELLYNGGDCEDYAITKLFSLRWLGFAAENLRVVVLQDTNLRIAHAVLAVAREGDIAILDNQVNAVVSHQQIVHYAPVYSINESSWWMHVRQH